jgi:error-prone DNA polymerase
MSLDETVVRDYDAIGFSLNAHPIGLIRAELDAMELSEGSRGIEGAREQGGKGSRTAAKRRAGLRVVAAETLRRMRNGQPVAVAGLVTCRQRPGTAKGVVFITLEDETGMANLIVRPNVWDEYRHIARGRVALLVSGHIERQGEVIHVMTRRFHDLSALLGGLKHASRDFH